MSENANVRGNERKASTGLSVIAATLRRAAAFSLAEPELLGLDQLVGPGDTCFDIGAAYGMYSFTLADLVGGSGSVHSFEPQRKPYGVLDTGRRLGGVEHLRPERAGMGREPGTSHLRLPVRFGLPIHGHAHVGDSTDERPRPTWWSHTRSLPTTIHSVDEVREQRSIERVHFMKVDVEGFEPSVVEGARKTIAEHRPALLLEIEDRHLGRYDTTAAEFTRSLREQGYTMYTWQRPDWVRTERVLPETRNYLFATDQNWRHRRTA